MPCNSNNSQYIDNSVDNLVLPIPLKFQVDRIKIVRVLLLVELKNAVLRKRILRKISPYLLSEAFDVEGCHFGNKIFLRDSLIPKVHFKQKN